MPLAGPTLVTAQGLLMYLRREEVDAIVLRLGEAPAGDFVFDAMPPWLVERSRSGKLARPGGYDPPPWHWALDDAEARRLASLPPRITEVRALPFPRGRGPAFGFLLPLLRRVESTRRRFLSVNRLTFGG
jgi:hypothetical protein